MFEILTQLPVSVGASWLRVACFSLTLVFLIDLLAKKLLRVREFRRKIDKLPGPPTPSLILGNVPSKVFSLLTNQSSQHAADFYTSQIQSVLGHTVIYKNEPLFRLWVGQEPVICVWKPEIVESVLNDSFLLEKSYHYDFLRPWLGNGLLTSPGRIWRSRRKLLVPSFHFNILQAFVPVFDRKSKLMVRNIKRKLAESIESSMNSESDKGNENSIVLDITPVITACTLDAICETIMGVAIDAQENPNNDYCQSIYVVGETFLERIIQPKYWLDFIFSRTELGKLYNYHLHKLHSFTRRVIAEKKSASLGAKTTGAPNGNSSDLETTSSYSGQERLADKVKVLRQSTVDRYQENKKGASQLPKAFLDLLLEKYNAQGEQKLTDEEIREEVDTFMFEGHDTTAMALSWTLFLLSHHSTVQEKLWREVDQVYAEHMLSDNAVNEEIELDILKKLRYLDCVIKEALRLCPSVPFIGRQTTNNLQLGNYSVPPGSVIFVLIYQLHRNPDIYPNPEQFNPDRFLPENTVGRHPFAYVPFSAGSRNCIGQKFAMAEMKTILLHLMRNFRFDPVTPMDKTRMQMEMVLRPKCALNVRISRRITRRES